jgi:uncharacterized protein (DUF302 family)
MEQTPYGLRVEIPVSYEHAVELATTALKAQGFGVLTTIDVQHTLKQKLGRDFRRYLILGACNPPLADRAIAAGRPRPSSARGRRGRCLRRG